MSSSVVVSIISPCLNGIKYLPKCIESVISQSFSKWELIFIDDGSTDGSLEYMKDISRKDSRFVILRTSGRTGSAASRNLGIKKSRGHYISFLDCDDWWQPDKLKIQTDFMFKNNVVFSCSQYFVCNSTEEMIRLQKCRKPLSRKRALLKINTIGCLTVMLDRTQLTDIEFPVMLKTAEDFSLWVMLLKQAEHNNLNVAVIDTPLAYYRTHENSKTNKKINRIYKLFDIYHNFFNFSLFFSFVLVLFYIFNSVYDRFNGKWSLIVKYCKKKST